MTTTNPGPAITSNPVPTGSVGNIQKQAILQTASITPAAVSANTTAQQSFTGVGLGTQPGDYLQSLALPGAFQAGLAIVNVTADATTNDKITITFANLTASPITPNAGSYTFEVSRPQPGDVVAAGSGYMNSF
ncbi:hypothetical protein AB1286_29925 [Trinickia sp. NRRL B-1857]|uniref:hypothetical protein n=1 Tax=Trinickia sp. NRRL B-1857 TaxID=3162879 RepID=UPI003D26EBA2